MRLTNSPDGYGFVHWALHWITAALIFWLFWLGLTMVELPISPQMFQDYALHKSLGLTVLVLVLARLAWRRLTGVPALPEGMDRKQWAHAMRMTTTILELYRLDDDRPFSTGSEEVAQ